MAFQITRNVSVERDAAGLVIGLQHLTKPFTTSSNLDSQSLASAYLRDVAGIYTIPAAWTAALETKPSTSIEAGSSTELRFSSRNPVTGTVTVSFQQTHFGLPIWQAGFVVNLLESELRVVSSQSSLHLTVDITQPKEDAPCLPRGITPDKLERLLGQNVSGIRIDSRRLWVYRYTANAPGINGAPPPVIQLRADPTQPVLNVPKPPDTFVEGTHYVVTEVLFRANLGSLREVPCRAMVEVETCTILYLLTLSAAFTGSVFLKDPITATGNASLSGCSTAATLDALRNDVTLEGLTAANPQNLNGQYVSIVDDSTPPLTPPTLNSPATDFTYSSRTDDFGAVNGYHHVDELFRLIESFGYSPISKFFSGTSLPIDVYYRDMSVVNATTYPNSTSTGLGYFTFGYCDDPPCSSGGNPVPIVADWRVVMHEFVHGMLMDRTHNGFLGFAHNGGDSFAVINMDPGSLAPDRFLILPFIPDVPRRCDRSVALGWAWGGSQADRSDSPFNPGYQSEEILSTTMFRLYRSTGGDSSSLAQQQLASNWILLVMTHAMASLPLYTVSPSTAVSYANALINADAGISSFYGVAGGAIGKVVRWSFEKQGLYQPSGAPTPVTTPGAPPPVDVYVNDTFYGEYGFQADYWDNTNIWNRLVIDPTTTPVDHQTPIVNQTNYAYVYISNRGTETATGVVVYGYHCRPSAPITWPDNFQAMTTASITVPGSIAPGSTVLVGPFEWTPTILGHECMLMVVSAEGDISNADPSSGLPCATGPTPEFRLVPFDNNIGQRNVAPIAGGGGLAGLTASFNPRSFWFNNPYNKQVRGSLEVTLPAFLKQRGWDVVFQQGSEFTVGPRGEREITFRLKPGQDFTATDVQNAGQDNRIIIRSLLDAIPAGGMSYLVDPNLKTPPSETSSSETCCIAPAQQLIKCIDFPSSQVKSVKVKRIVLEIDFKDEC